MTYRVETIISQNGTLTLYGIPFRAGDKVEVIVAGVPVAEVPDSLRDSEARYPLRGKPIRYAASFESVAEGDWEVLR